MDELKRGQLSTKRLNKFLATTGTPVNGVKATGVLTIAEPVTADDTMTVGATTYTFKAGATAAAGEIGIGASEAATKLAIVAALNGTDSENTANASVVASAFSTDDCTLTAKAYGISGNAIETTETFTHVDNVFDADLLGGTVAGVSGTQGVDGSMHRDGSYLYVCVGDSPDGNHVNWRRISIGSAY